MTRYLATNWADDISTMRLRNSIGKYSQLFDDTLEEFIHTKSHIDVEKNQPYAVQNIHLETNTTYIED